VRNHRSPYRPSPSTLLPNRDQRERCSPNGAIRPHDRQQVVSTRAGRQEEDGQTERTRLRVTRSQGKGRPVRHTQPLPVPKQSGPLAPPLQHLRGTVPATARTRRDTSTPPPTRRLGGSSGAGSNPAPPCSTLSSSQSRPGTRRIQTRKQKGQSGIQPAAVRQATLDPRSAASLSPASPLRDYTTPTE
jgi:hypothetical protein